MKILTVHNKYKIRGGEDESREAESSLLESRGHEIKTFVLDNDSIVGIGAIRSGFEATWCQSSYENIRRVIGEWRPDLVDVQNFFPLGSPSVHYAAFHSGIPVIQTLRNFRLVCPGAALFREGSVCEKCLGKTLPWAGILHGCYRGNRLASTAVATMLLTHNLLGTWRKCVTTFVALTEFARRKYIEGGLPAEKLIVKPNFVPVDLGRGPGGADYVLYVGRMSEEKGVRLLLEAWRLASPKGRLLLVGEGPLTPVAQERANESESIVHLGRVPIREACDLMGKARALVFPSLWYEGMPRVIIEAFCKGTPVIASRLGSMQEMVVEGKTGWFVNAGDRQSLAAALSRPFCAPDEAAGMRAAARIEFEEKYTAERNYSLMMDLYGRAIASRKALHQ
jgi:glycosyltransferase involved in cell wall biosynthesis